VELLEHNDNTNDCQHTMHDRHKEKHAQFARFKYPKQHLQYANHDNNNQNITITHHNITLPQFDYDIQNYNNQTYDRTINNDKKTTDSKN
jgi:hypothetical protein